MFVGHQKGRNTKENIFRNFAMPTPHGYQKAPCVMKYADHHRLPIITLVDTPGAFADLKSEEFGQGEAIAHNLRTMFGLKVPLSQWLQMKAVPVELLLLLVPINCLCWRTQLLMLQAEKLRIKAQEHYRLKIADGIIPEPLGGAHSNPVWTCQQIKLAITQAMEELTKLDTEDLLRHQMQKFRYIGGFQEGIPVDPERKCNMKPSGVNMLEVANIESDLNNLKKKILEDKIPSDPITSKAIGKLRHDVDKEITNAFISMGLQ